MKTKTARLLLPALLMLLAILPGCERQRQNVPEQIIAEPDIPAISVSDILETEAAELHLATEQDFAGVIIDIRVSRNIEIRFVTAEAGLDVRSLASLDGEIVHRLSFGQRILVVENKKVYDMVNGIYGYWYPLGDWANYGAWVFGGYLSERLPPDAPIVLGTWDWENAPGHIWSFFHPDRFVMGPPLARASGLGTWELLGDTLTLSWFSNDEESDIWEVSRVDKVRLIVDEEDKIRLEFPRELGGGRTAYLVRSRSLWY